MKDVNKMVYADQMYAIMVNIISELIRVHWDRDNVTDAATDKLVTGETTSQHQWIPIRDGNVKTASVQITLITMDNVYHVTQD
jgi:hypothetical protein